MNHPAALSQSILLLSVTLPTALSLPALGQMIEERKVLSVDGERYDEFGRSVSIGSGVIAIGASHDDYQGTDCGSVYLYTSGGSFIRKLTPSDGAPGDEFGNSVSIHNGIVVVGAWRHDQNGADSGAAYLFDVATGSQIAKLLPDNGSEGSYFGNAVAIHNGVVVVGEWLDDEQGHDSGAAYLFDAQTGAQLRKLIRQDPAAQDHFGYSVAIDSGRVAVGSVRDADLGFWSGSAYVFDAESGAQISKLLPHDGAIEDRFGHSIAIEGDVVAVGMLYQADNGYRSGAAYLFDASTGAQTHKLLAFDGENNDWFGGSIAIDRGVVAVGASLDDDQGLQSGSAYLFDTTSGTQIAKLLTSDGANGDQFGNAIDLENGVVTVGALYDDDHGTLSGSVYLFAVPGGACPVDVNGDGILDLGDITQYLASFLSGDLSADTNSDGILDGADLRLFVSRFLEGC